ncbi:uncharacterized protein ACNLHF_019928 [Anomaloglossus baeobatrachus]|uniref:uncharacterized protein LOC142310249 n=1 Tax=Anomaloglossus baeobatrachus TaxID=238106 RepID=UPI003F50B60D
MLLNSFVLCCLGHVFFIAGTVVDDMEIMEERNILKEFLKYPLNNPKKDLDLRVVSFHLRPLTRNKSIKNSLDKVDNNPHSGQTIQLGGRIQDEVKTSAKPKPNYKVPLSNIQKEYEKLRKKYSQRKSWSKKLKKPQKSDTVEEPKLTHQSEEGEGFKEVKRKKLRSKRIELFSRSWKKKQPTGEKQSISGRIKEIQISKLPRNWGDYLGVPPMIDGEVLNEDVLVTYHLGGESSNDTQQMDVLQKRDEEEEQKFVIRNGSREHVTLDYARHRKMNFFSESGGEVTSKKPSTIKDHLEETESSLVTIANEHFIFFPNGGAEQSSVTVHPTSNGGSELPPDDAQGWTVLVPIAENPIIEVYSDTIQPEETYTKPYKTDYQTPPSSQEDFIFQKEGSGRYNSVSPDHEDNIVTLTPQKGKSETTHKTPQFLQTPPIADIQQSSYNTSPSPTHKKNSEVPRTTGNEKLLDGIFSPLEATMSPNPGPIYCKPGYKEYGGVCKSQCDIGGISCGKKGQCIIVENIGAMCRCQQMRSLCYGGECCRSSLTTFQLACVIGGCCILLCVLLAFIPFLIRRIDIKTISKSVRTRLWISTLMPQSSMSSSSRSVDFTCSDYQSLSDPSTFHCTKEMARNFTMWQCERTRL